MTDQRPRKFLLRASALGVAGALVACGSSESTVGGPACCVASQSTDAEPEADAGDSGEVGKQVVDAGTFVEDAGDSGAIGKQVYDAGIRIEDAGDG